MKHYIYLTEDKLYYIRKENRARGYSFMGSRTITGPETVTGAMESLADIYNLKGRAVVLAIEASVKIHFMSLPASSKKTALQMAEKQLLVLGEEGERLLAADFMPNNGQGMLKGTVYTVSEAWIRAIETGALITRFRIHSILPGPALLASFLEPSDYGMNKGTVIFVHLADQSIVFYQMENGLPSSGTFQFKTRDVCLSGRRKGVNGRSGGSDPSFSDQDETGKTGISDTGSPDPV